MWSFAVSCVEAVLNERSLKKKLYCIFQCLVCKLKADTGPCRAAIPKFFFDSDSGNCQRFIYGGCDGNENRFDTLEECETTSKRIGCKP